MDFHPYVILRSMYADDVCKVFNHLYSGTDYGDKVQQIRKERKDGNIVTAMYDAISYYIAAYAIFLFNQFLFSVTHETLHPDWEFVRENYEPNFVSTAQDLHVESCIHGDIFRSKLLSIPKTHPVHAEYAGNSGRNKQYPTEKGLDQFREMLTLEYGINEGIHGISLEEISSRLDEHFVFVSEEEKGQWLTWVLLRYLHIDVWVDDSYYDFDEEIIYHVYMPY